MYETFFLLTSSTVQFKVRGRTEGETEDGVVVGDGDVDTGAIDVVDGEGTIAELECRTNDVLSVWTVVFNTGVMVILRLGVSVTVNSDELEDNKDVVYKDALLMLLVLLVTFSTFSWSKYP